MNTFGWWSLIPALCTIAATIITREVALALFCGVAAGSLVIAKFGLFATGKTLAMYMSESFGDEERLKMALFLLLVGGLLEIISRSGAFEAFADFLARFLDSARKVRVTAFFLGLALFFDDYANLMIAGASMRAISARQKISPALLAYLIDTVALVVSLVVISTWAAFESSVIISAAAVVKISGSGMALLTASLPFHFFTVLSIWQAFLTAVSGRWVGARFDDPAEEQAATVGSLSPRLRIRHALAPILVLIVTAIAGIFFFGAYKHHLAGGKAMSWAELLGESPTIDILLGAAMMALGACVLLLKEERVVGYREMGRAFKAGLGRMVSPALVIIFAKGLSMVSGDLGTGTFITAKVGALVIPAVLPAFIFGVSMLITIATGFSWSAMAIVMPVAFQMGAALTGTPDIPVLAGAVISGAICGGLLIPFSDTSVMASAACGIPPIRHVKTQAGPVLIAILGTLTAYGLMAFGVHLTTVYLVAGLLVTALYALCAGLAYSEPVAAGGD